MADNVGYTPGSGANIAADDIGGVLHQRVKIGVGVDGEAVDVSADSPMPVIGKGELVEVLEAMRTTLQVLTANIGTSMPDVSGRLRVAIEAISGSLTLSTITTVGTVTTVTAVSTVSNQTNVGGFAANDQIPALMSMAAEALRSNIVVTP